jgi:hypothetical protein
MAAAVQQSALGFASDAEEDSAILSHGHFGRSESHGEGLLIWGFFFSRFARSSVTFTGHFSELR